jgi:hypothetical protein
LDPIAFICSATRYRHDSVALSVVVLVFTFVISAVGPSRLALAPLDIIVELTFVNLACLRPGVLAEANFFAVHPVALVNVSIRLY